ncbi:MAG: hypothetical protein ACJ8DC_13420 [Gemmatimonadales bacterium]
MPIPMGPFAAASVVLLLGAPVRAQSLQDLVGQLFVVGQETAPLWVNAQDLSQPTTAPGVEDDGFLPSASSANGAVLDFLTRWVGVSPGYFPVGSTSGGLTFHFEGGLPVAAAVSAGPIYGERGHTLGRGRAVVGANYTSTRFNTSRGKPIDDLRLEFTHSNIDSDQCDAEEGRDCAPLGVPASENDLLEVLLTLDLDVDVASLFATYGLLDRIDLGLIVPVVHTSLAAHSIAQIIPFGGLPTGATHFLAGTAEDPVLSTTQVVAGSATGIGDIAGRLKVNLLDRNRAAVALLADVRAPTGDEKDFLGTGEWAFRGLGILSLQFGDFSPHVNAGYVWRGRNAANRVANDAILATLGFDQVFAPWATFSADVISELQLGRSVFEVPAPVTFTAPFVRSVRPMEISDARDNLVTVSLGFRLATLSNFMGVANTLIPVTGSSPRPDFAWTVGVEYDF